MKRGILLAQCRGSAAIRIAAFCTALIERRFLGWMDAPTAERAGTRTATRRRSGPLALVAPMLVGLAGVLWSGASTAFAQVETVTLGSQPVHATRLLGRFKASVAATVDPAALGQFGSTIERRSQLVPGLVVLGEAAGRARPAGLTAGDEAAMRQRLLERLQALQGSGLFEYVEPDPINHLMLAPNDAAFVNGMLWGLRNYGQYGGMPGADIGAEMAWDLTTGSTNVVVAVIDTGIRYSHRDLTNQMWINVNEIPGNLIDDDANGFVDDVHGIDAIAGTGDLIDDVGHGTHCSGTIGAAANDGNQHVGVAWKVQLMGCRFLSAAGGGATSDAMTCIDYAVTQGAHVINASWGGYYFSQALFDTIERAGDHGVLFVAAAANDSNDNDFFPAYPASFRLDNVISVAALDRNDYLAGFSNYGANSVHLGAPGVEIFSCMSGFDLDYEIMDGTSMAAPHVTGVAALILAMFPGSDHLEMRDRLLSGTVPITALTGLTTTGGRLNAYNSLTLTGDGVMQVTVDPPSGSVLLAGSTQPIYVKVRDRYGIRDATVTGAIVNDGTLAFPNDGTAPDLVANDPIYTGNLLVPALADSISIALTVTAPDKGTLTNLLHYTIIPPPPNDHFELATKVPRAGAAYLANNLYATLQPGEPQHGGNPAAAGSLWWRWTGDYATNILVDAAGSGVGTILAVYTGNALTNLKSVMTVADQPGTRGTNLFFQAEKSTSYSIAVAGLSSNSLGSIRLRIVPGGKLQTQPPQVSIATPINGLLFTTNSIKVEGTAEDVGPQASGIAEVLVSVNGSLASSAAGTTNWSRPALLQVGANQIVARSVNLAGLMSEEARVIVHYRVPPPPNDDFDGATLLAGTEGTVTNDSRLATQQPGEPLHAGKPGGHSLWWKWTAPADGALLLSTEGSSFDTTLGLYTGPRVNALRTVASNDDAFEGSLYSKLQQGVRMNGTYYWAVDGFNGLTGKVQVAYAFTPGTLYTINLQATTGGSVAEHDLGAVDVLANSSQTLTAVPDPEYEFTGWEGAVVSSSNPVSFQVNSNLTVRATFRKTLPTDDFETGTLSKLNWVAGGAKPWTVTSTTADGGVYAAGSGAIGHGQTSTLTLTDSFYAGTVAFSLRISSEPNWDYAEFLIDGVPQMEWSGEVEWTRYSYPISTGTHTLEWRYVKDNAVTSGLDAAFIDNFTAIIVPPTNASTPARLSLALMPQGEYQLLLVGQANQVYTIQGATELPPGRSAVWQPFATNVAVYGEIRIMLDAQALSRPQTYFRALAQ